MLDWFWEAASITHDGARYPFNVGYHVTQDPATQGPDGDVNDFLSTAGMDDPTGTWVVVIPELSYRAASGVESKMTGPWTLTVTMP